MNIPGVHIERIRGLGYTQSEARFLYINGRINTGDLWRGRMEVESTTRSAKERVAGFEDREGHRTPFAPAATIT